LPEIPKDLEKKQSIDPRLADSGIVSPELKNQKMDLNEVNEIIFVLVHE
jgi:hypothetical protein